jgi:DNA (cytosine-5)-methyltransferase 1
MIVGSLFSGIGGFDLGLERAGMRTAWFCEQDEFCQRVLAKHWPGVPCYGDIRELSGDAVGPVDVLCGGFPCSDISLTGHGAGLSGARSGLWTEYARLIGELRPRYVIVENVAALRSRGLGSVLGEMAALGYDAEWDCVPASAIGAPHRRDRIWLVAYPSSERGRARLREVGAREEAGALHEPEPCDSGSAGGAGDVANADRFGRSEGLQLTTRTEQRPRARDAEWAGPGAWASPWPAEPAIRRVVDGLPDRLDRCHALGNALVPQIAEWIGHRIMSYEESR